MVSIFLGRNCFHAFPLRIFRRKQSWKCQIVGVHITFRADGHAAADEGARPASKRDLVVLAPHLLLQRGQACEISTVREVNVCV